MSQDPVITKVKAFIMSEFLDGEDPDELTDDVELISTGILDSLATLKLVDFLEEEFNITVEPHEADQENLNTLESMARLVHSK